MPKKKKETKTDNNQSQQYNQYVPEICRLKHESIDKEFANIKNKIIISEKSLGDKIDKLARFDDNLKGNGSPGVWESIRAIKTQIRVIFFLIFILFVFYLNGEYRGITGRTFVQSLLKPFIDKEEKNNLNEIENKEINLNKNQMSIDPNSSTI